MKKIFFLFYIAICYLSINGCVNESQPEILNNTASQYGTPFKNIPEPRDVTLYQVNIRTFSENGDFNGVINRLDFIESLGVNVLYLMPIYPVGQVNSVNSPYCITDYTAVNEEFGTLEDLRLLVEEAHERDMAVILDWVANHTAYDHKWIDEHRTWYLQDSLGNIMSPPGQNWNDVAQLDFSNQAMRLEMIKTMKNWVLKANVDGFRCDYTDGPPIDFWNQAIDTLRNISNHELLLMAEGQRNDNYLAGFDFNFGFGFYGNLKQVFDRNKSVKSIEELNDSEYEKSTNEQQVIRYITNHDVNSSDGTPLDLFGGEEGSMAAFVVVSYMKSVPMIYNGQEVGTSYQLTFPFTSSTIDWDVNPDITAEYKKIISFRNESEAIRRGDLTSFCSDDVCAFTKKYEEEEVLVLVNLRDQNVEFDFDSNLANTSWKDVMNNNEAVQLSSSVQLAPFQYIVLKK